MWTLRVLLFFYYCIIILLSCPLQVQNKSFSIEAILLASWSWFWVRTHTSHISVSRQELTDKPWMWARSMRSKSRHEKFGTNVGLKKKSSETNKYMISWPGSRGRTLALKRGIQRKTRWTVWRHEIEDITSDHGNHNQGCWRHNSTWDQSSGEGMHGWLATTQLPSTSNSTDFWFYWVVDVISLCSICISKGRVT